MSDGAFGYRDLLEPTPQEKLEAHVLAHPNDLLAFESLRVWKRIESLEQEVSGHASVVNMRRPLD